MGPVARRNFTLDVTGQPCCLVHSSSWVRPHTGRKLQGFLNQMQKFGHTQKAKFRVFAVYKWLSSLDFYFSLSLLPSFFAFLASFFSLAGHLVGFILVGKVWRKHFSILGLNERKGRWVMEQDFHGNFRVTVTWSFAVLSSVLDGIVLILVWFERFLRSAQANGQSYPWLVKLMTSQAVARTRLRAGANAPLIKKPKSRLLPIFSPDFTLNSQIRLFYAEKWIFLKKLGTLLNEITNGHTDCVSPLLSCGYFGRLWAGVWQ